MADNPEKEAQKDAACVSEFIAEGDSDRSDMHDIWNETMDNFMVRPLGQTRTRQRVEFPFLEENDLDRYQRGYATIKDPESHQIVESLVGDEMEALYGMMPEGIKCTPVGIEDAVKADTAQRLLHYFFRQPGHYLARQVRSRYKFVMGTSVVKLWWRYDEMVRMMRSGSYGEDGALSMQSTVNMVPTYDDPCMRMVDMTDFFWDTSETQIAEMYGAAERLYFTASTLRKQKMFDKRAVEKAISIGSNTKDSKEEQDKGWRRGMDYPNKGRKPASAKEMIAYSYYGNASHKHADGVNWRWIVVCNGVTLLSKPWYSRIPFYESTVCPLIGRFPGLSPLEVIRYSQDFTDSMKMGLGDAISRMVYSMMLVSRDSGIHTSHLRRWKPDRPVMTDQMDGLAFLNYSPNIGPVAGFYNGEKQQMREASGAVGAFQGFGLGVNRASGTEAAGTMQRAGVRPAANHSLEENEYLPAIAMGVLELYQQNLDSDEELALRIGEQPESVSMADIMTKFDIEFSGSRQAGTKSDAIAAYRELFGLRSDPVASARVPWDKVIQRFMRLQGLHMEAMEVGTPETVHDNVLLQLLSGRKGGIGGGNGTDAAAPPPGAGTPQLAGDVG